MGPSATLRANRWRRGSTGLRRFPLRQSVDDLAQQLAQLAVPRDAQRFPDVPLKIADDVLGLQQFVAARVGEMQFLDIAVTWVRPALDR
jgi:hypothetical protein